MHPSARTLFVGTTLALALTLSGGVSNAVDVSLLGSWEQTDTDTGDVFFATFHGSPSGGSFNFTSPDSSISLSHGTWRRTGAFTFDAVGYLFDGSGMADRRFKFNTRIRVEPLSSQTLATPRPD